MTREEEWQNWRDRFDKTHNGVLRLFHDRAIWRTVRAMLDSNPAIPRGGSGEIWLQSCYVNSQLIGIRRESDNHKDSVGLLRSLSALAAGPRMATRAWYQQHIRDEYPRRNRYELEEMYSLFDHFASPGAAFIDAARVQDDIASLKAVIDNVNAYTTTVIAHRDAAIARGTVPSAAITWRDLDDALDTIGTIHARYYTLCHPGETLFTLAPVTPPGWEQLFAQSWKPPGFPMPEPFTREPPGISQLWQSELRKSDPTPGAKNSRQTSEG